MRSSVRLFDGTAAVGFNEELLSTRRRRRSSSVFAQVALVRLWSVWLLCLEKLHCLDKVGLRRVRFTLCDGTVCGEWEGAVVDC